MLRSERNASLNVGGLALPLLALDLAAGLSGGWRAPVCVSSRRGADGKFREVRRWNRWNRGDTPDVIPCVQDALSPILPAPTPRILIAGRR